METLFTEDEIERRRLVMLDGITYVGVDPGLDGAVAAILPDNTVQFSDTPAVLVGKGKGQKRDYNIQGMRAILIQYSFGNNQNVHVVIESVHAMPEQGVSSSFSFGRGLGIWQGLVAALQMPYTMVSPQRWKASQMPDMQKDKDASRIRALQLFPYIHADLNLKKHHGRADALLMARYAKEEAEF